LPWSKMLKHLTDAGSQGSFLACSLCKVQHDKFGFTLAEVLITIGVIGVVAAVTIPNMISNYKKHVVETRLVKFYSTINQAIKLAEADYGDKAGWESYENGVETDDDGNITKTYSEDWVNKYVKPYLKADTKITNTNGLTEIHFHDGSMVAVEGTGWHFYPYAEKFKLDENGKEIWRGKQIDGTYMFHFYFKPDSTNKWHRNAGVEPYKIGWAGTKEDALLRCNPTTNANAYCAALIQLNGWKIPKDYPLRF